MTSPGIRLLMAASRPSAGITDPTDIADLVRWVDASDTGTITNAGGAVTSWVDKSGVNNHLTTNYNGTPTSGSRTINSLNAIDYDSDDVSGSPVVAAVSTNGLTIFAVAHPDASHNGSIYSEARTADNADQLLLRQISTVPGFSIRDGVTTAQIDLIGTTNTVGSDVLLTAVVASGGGACEFRVNGAVEDTQGTYTGVGTLTVDVGATGYLVRSSDAIPFNGAIGELVIYERALNSTEVGQVETYLNDKWAIY